MESFSISNLSRVGFSRFDFCRRKINEFIQLQRKHSPTTSFEYKTAILITLARVQKLKQYISSVYYITVVIIIDLLVAGGCASIQQYRIFMVCALYHRTGHDGLALDEIHMWP